MGLRLRVEGSPGFDTGLRLDDGEFADLRARIENQWQARLARLLPEEQFEQAWRLGIARYHEIAPWIDHSRSWPKAERILSREDFEAVQRMPFMATLRRELGPFEITDEEELGYGQIYWRLCRPNEDSDNGSLHADRWFWDLGHGRTPLGKTRMKVWIAVHCEPSRNGLQVVYDSHLRSFRYHGELRDGIMKPVLDEELLDLDPQLLNLSPGETVIFNDELLHMGAPNRGQKSRVSTEFTIFVD
jgi:hypothetical protein